MRINNFFSYNSDAPEVQGDPAPLVAPIVLLLLQTR